MTNGENISNETDQASAAELCLCSVTLKPNCRGEQTFAFIGT